MNKKSEGICYACRRYGVLVTSVGRGQHICAECKEAIEQMIDQINENRGIIGAY